MNNSVGLTMLFNVNNVGCFNIAPPTIMQQLAAFLMCKNYRKLSLHVGTQFILKLYIYMFCLKRKFESVFLVYMVK